MCGICGIVGFGEAPEVHQIRARVDAMLDALRHRGPNATGARGADDAVLGATRLAVRGIAAPDQPSVDLPTGVIVVCNGEIDNHEELRRWLEGRGRSVPAGSDVEVLPGLYLELGDAFVERLAGAFALAVWDPRSRRLLLARDRAGERPLFFTTLPGQFRFASEVAALRESGGVSPQFSGEGIRGYLQFGNFAAPRSPFAHIEKVAPGERLVRDASGLQRSRYWRWSVTRCAKRAPSLEDFDSVFREAVRRQSDMETRFAVFLSGGLDSSLVAAVARSLRPELPLRAYTVRFDVESFDEGDVAATVAQRLGLEQRCVWVRPEDLQSELPALVRRVGEPLADPAWLPAALLAREAARDFRMTLVGEGADELFGGYPTYLGALLAQRFNRLPGAFQSLLRRAVNALPASEGKVTVSYLLKRFVHDAGVEGMARHQLWNSQISPELLRRLGVAPAPLPGELPPEGDLMDRIQQWDLEVPLAEGLLTKADRASMSSAMELRAPFLDVAVLEFAASLPVRERVRGFTTKVFLKRYAARYLPGNIVHRRKRGLSVPLGRWLRGPMRDWAAASLEGRHLEPLGLRPAGARAIFQEHLDRKADHARALWTLIVLSHWHQQVAGSEAGRDGADT
ncbi:MAG: asparagine synthase (glutamine-hydrolyzing) [Verrucomicrobiae bacterium]|nr:asparagine synthase (glutamine-hydrolyzing) [Verrucomicrobiae bacterium]